MTLESPVYNESYHYGSNDKDQGRNDDGYQDVVWESAYKGNTNAMLESNNTLGGSTVYMI